MFLPAAHLWILLSCADWPLYAHLPLDTAPSWPQGASVDQALDWREESWEDPSLESELRLLYTHQGVLLQGSRMLSLLGVLPLLQMLWQS